MNRASKILILIISVLTIVNVAAVVTVVYNLRKFHPPPEIDLPGSGITDDDLKETERGPAFLITELGLDEGQQSAFRESHRRFRENARPLFAEIRQINSAIADELNRENPDSLLLFQHAEKIGLLHGQIKMLTIRHLHDLKQIATPAQQEKLQFFYRDLLLRDSGPAGKGMQHRGRWR